MQPIRSLARPLVALPFVVFGLETLRDPRPCAERVAPTVKSIVDRMDWLPTKDPVALVRLQGALSLGTGTLLTLGRFQRLATLVLSAQLMSSLLTEHHYWIEDDPDRRAGERSQLLKTVGLFGALLMIATEPRSRTAIVRRARYARRKAGAETRRLRKRAAERPKALAKR